MYTVFTIAFIQFFYLHFCLFLSIAAPLLVSSNLYMWLVFVVVIVVLIDEFLLLMRMRVDICIDYMCAYKHISTYIYRSIALVILNK